MVLATDISTENLTLFYWNSHATVGASKCQGYAWRARVLPDLGFQRFEPSAQAAFFILLLFLVANLRYLPGAQEASRALQSLAPSE